MKPISQACILLLTVMVGTTVAARAQEQSSSSPLADVARQKPAVKANIKLTDDDLPAPATSDTTPETAQPAPADSQEEARQSHYIQSEITRVVSLLQQMTDKLKASSGEYHDQMQNAIKEMQQTLDNLRREQKQRDALDKRNDRKPETGPDEGEKHS
jgi:hypothetical protein